MPPVPAAFAPMGSYPSMPSGQARGAMPQEQGQRPSAGGYVPPRLAVPQSRAPIVRGQMEDEPAPLSMPKPSPVKTTPVMVSMPAPSALGVTAPEDWTTCLARLDQLGMTGMQAQQLPQGGWKFVCQLKTAQAGRVQRIESGPAMSKTAAIKLALAEAERLSTSR